MANNTRYKLERPSGTRSGRAYTDEQRQAALKADKQKKEAEAANRRYRKEVTRRARLADEAAAAAAAIEQGDTPAEELDPVNQPQAEPLPAVPTPPTSAPPQRANNPFAQLNIQPARMPYDEENGADAADALSKVGGVQKLEFKRRDCKFWLQQVEARMRLIGVRSQWTKMQIVSCMLPDDVAEQVKHLLRVEETDAGDRCYKKVKVYLLELYGDKVEDVYNKASSLTMTSTPSHLARQLIDIMCEKHPTLTDCCCTPYLTGLWKSKLPEQVRIHISGMTLAGANMEATLRAADAVHRSLGLATTPKVAALQTPQQAESSGASGYDPQVAAFNQTKSYGNNQGNHNKGQNKGSGNNQQNQGQKKKSGTKKKPTRSPDGPPEEACYNHYKYGKSTWFCLDTFNCPWATYLTPRPKK